MGIFRTNDPTQFNAVDGIIINESAPPPNIAGVPANIAILIGQSQRGKVGLHQVNSIGDLLEMYGKDDTKGINQALKGKSFGSLKVSRVVAANSATALLALQSAAVTRITFHAKQGPGTYGNAIQVKVEAGSTQGSKYTIRDTNPNAVIPDEVFDNIVLANATSNAFARSQLIEATINNSGAEPTTMDFTNLAGGSDGTIADTDYQTAISYAEASNSGNFIFLDAYNAARNGYLKAHVSSTTDKMAILAGGENDSVADAIADVANYRDSDGRIIYAYPYVQTTIGGSNTFVNPASFVASVLSQTAPSIDPASKVNARFLESITDLKRQLTRNDYISLMQHGIMAFEKTSDGLYKIKSGIVTQISDSSKLTVLRRRMADFLTVSAANFLENYQNLVNDKLTRTLVKGALLGFVTSLENAGILPSDSDVKQGKAKLIDTESLNTDASIAQGYFKILWKQRIKSSMRFIVLQAEIGESVVVTAQG